jgi:hypothetical protein
MRVIENWWNIGRRWERNDNGIRRLSNSNIIKKDWHRDFLGKCSTHCLRGPELLKIGIIVLKKGIRQGDAVLCEIVWEAATDVGYSRVRTGIGIRNHVISLWPIGIRDTHPNGVRWNIADSFLDLWAPAPIPNGPKRIRFEEEHEEYDVKRAWWK